MIELTPKLTPELQLHVGTSAVAKAEAYPVDTYRELVEHTARLAYLNKDHLLFFRGQRRDYKNRSGASSFYPSIYRDDMLKREEVGLRFRLLDRASAQLRALFMKGRIEGHPDLARKRYVQWSVLQHYEVTRTPLLDFTHSHRVACSFARDPDESAARVYVFVFGLPYLTNRISFNSEQDTVVVRLLSICPPTALRPYFQDGYLAGTPEVSNEYDSKSEMDFTHRLIAKFSIPNRDSFWGQGLRGLSMDELYPAPDGMKELCDQIRVDESMLEELPRNTTSALGDFVAAWAGLERQLVGLAQNQAERIVSVPQAIRALRASGWVEPWLAEETDRIRALRNSVVHGHEPAHDDQLRQATNSIAEIRRSLELEQRKRRSPRRAK